ncbi:MAG: hypothetical protein BWY61_01641 [Firmicutes bacterium ADurb.Bin354]|nr:MAG: hypothetical protein BWY61_01641 [Firmicutes bacterium ADurb.Bin354]
MDIEAKVKQIVVDKLPPFIATILNKSLENQYFLLEILSIVNA